MDGTSGAGRVFRAVGNHPLRSVLIGVLVFAAVMAVAYVECYVWHWHPLG